MRTLAILDTYSTAVMALAMTFTVACTGPNQSSNPATTATAKKADTDGISTQQMVDGTTDGAGGNGTQGKIYESYIVNPYDLPAYKEIIQKKMMILEKINEQIKAEMKGGDNSITLTYESFWKLKTWYLAPISLKSLNKKVIGVEFTVENTEQLAIQTDNEVWIDARAFEKMNVQDQATLLMHEYLMSLYLLKREPSKSQCTKISRLTKEWTQGFCDGDLPGNPQVNADLNKNDYEKIRIATADIMAIDENTSFKNLLDIMSIFDSSGIHQEKTMTPIKGNDNYLSTSETLELLKSAYQRKAFTGPCFGLASDTARQECVFDLAVKEDEGKIQITVKDTSTGEILRNASIEIPGPSYIYTFETSDKNLVYQVELSLFPRSPHEGDALDSLKIVFEGSDKPEEYKQAIGIALYRQVVSSITESTKEQEGKALKCKKTSIESVIAKNIKEDTILLTSKPEIKDHLFFSQKFLGFRGGSSCYSQ